MRVLNFLLIGLFSARKCERGAHSNCRASTTRQLRRRLYLVERLRDARRIGLVVGTLTLDGYREAIARVRRLCKTARKQLYVLSIGKVGDEFFSREKYSLNKHP